MRYMEGKFGLSELNLRELHAILSSIPHIEEAIIYGSRARGNYKNGSDVDLSLKGRDLTFHDLAVLDDKLYCSYIPYFFDTNDYNRLTNTALIDSINREGEVIYKKHSEI